MGAYVVDCGGAMNFYTKKPRIRTVSVRHQGLYLNLLERLKGHLTNKKAPKPRGGLGFVFYD